MTPEDFMARHEGEPCFLCEKPVLKNDEVRYYGGPYVMHGKCVDQLLDPYRLNSKKDKNPNV